MGSGEGRRVGPGGGSGGGRAPGVEHRALDAGVGRRGWARGWAPGFGPGAGERVGRPKRRPGQLGGRTVGWAAGRPNGRVKEWKGWQGRTEKDGNGKGPGPSGSRSVKGSFGQPLRSAKGLFRQGSGPSEPRPAGVPSRESRTPSSPDPPESRPVEGSFGPSPGSQRAVPSRSRPVEGSFGHPPPVSKGPFRQGPGPSGARPVKGQVRPSLGPPEFLPERVAPRQGPARPGLGLSRVRSVTLPRSAKGLFHQGPGSSEARPVKGPVRPSLGSPEFLPGRVAPPLHVRVPTAPFPLSSPFMSSSPLPLRRLLPLRRPAPPSCVPVRLSRRGRDSTAGGGIARAKMWNGISGAERRAAAASGAPLPRPPGSRPEPTPGRQTSRERGGERHPGKGKTKSRKGFSSRRGRNRRSGEAAKRQSREGKTGGAMLLYRDETEQR